mmetsp:Transcript_13559/g.47868  ORF Transcript_13559/g.47868 Transcript_13559/m.47868 type:complete len:204 (+) Transcript_13559:640-1251(+)
MAPTTFVASAALSLSAAVATATVRPLALLPSQALLDQLLVGFDAVCLTERVHRIPRDSHRRWQSTLTGGGKPCRGGGIIDHGSNRTSEGPAGLLLHAGARLGPNLEDALVRDAADLGTSCVLAPSSVFVLFVLALFFSSVLLLMVLRALSICFASNLFLLFQHFPLCLLYFLVQPIGLLRARLPLFLDHLLPTSVSALLLRSS